MYCLYCKYFKLLEKLNKLRIKGICTKIGIEVNEGQLSCMYYESRKESEAKKV